MGRKWFPYPVVAIGGTFDKFHKGHEQLVTAAFRIGERVVIGVVGDTLVRTLTKNHPVQPYSSRVRALKRFLKTRRWASRAIIARLEDPYGPAAHWKDVEAMVITPDTLASARKLNRLRKTRSLPVLKIHKVPLSMAEDGRPISSTRIRRGEIDRNGRLLHR